jgi:hypothetical protein
MSSGGYFSILENFPNFREMKPTCGLPITKFASTFCFKPTYITQGNITAVFLFDNKHDSYQLPRPFYSGEMRIGDTFMIYAKWWIFFHFGKISKLRGDETNIWTPNYQVCIYTLP